MAKMTGSKLADSMAYPPRAMRADRAAAYLSMSTSTFLELVEKGRLPKGKKLAGMRFWDRLALDSFVENYEGEADEDRVNEKWSKILGDDGSPTLPNGRKPPSKPWSSANSKSYK